MDPQKNKAKPKKLDKTRHRKSPKRDTGKARKHLKRKSVKRSTKPDEKNNLLNYGDDEIYDYDAIIEFMSQDTLPNDDVFLFQLSQTQQTDLFGNNFVNHINERLDRFQSSPLSGIDSSDQQKITYIPLNIEKQSLLHSINISKYSDPIVEELKQLISENPEEYITFIYDENAKFGGNFIMIFSHDLNDTLLSKDIYESDEEATAIGLDEEADDNIAWKYPTAKSLEFLDELKDETFIEHRSRLICNFERPRKDFGCQRILNPSENREETYAEIKPYENKNFNIPIMELEQGISCVNLRRENTANTDWKNSRNQVIQYVPRMTATEEKNACILHTPASDNSNVIKLFEQYMRENWIFDFLKDDFTDLGTEDVNFDDKSTNTLREISVFSDLRFVKDKAISHVEWHPTIEGLVAMSIVEKITYHECVDQMSRIHNTPTYIVIWSVFDTSQPQLLLLAPEDIQCFSFNPTAPHIVAGGCVNGQVILWDISGFDLTNIAEKIKTQNEPALFNFDDNEHDQVPIIQWCATSNIETSHSTPITCIKWLPDHIDLDANGMPYENIDQRNVQILTCATDGGLFLWDMRPEKCTLMVDKTRDQIAMPYFVPQTFKSLDAKWKPLLQINLFRSGNTTDHCPTCFSIKERQGDRSVLSLKSNLNKKVTTDDGSSRPSLKQFSPLNGVNTTIICGTEEGDIVHVDWMPQKDAKTAKLQTPMPSFTTQYHDGPILFLDRSPFLRDVYLCVGGFSWSLWKENVTSGPLLCSAAYTKAPTGGSWSLSRPSVFYIIRADGVLEAWDLLDKTNEPILVHSISTTALTSLDIKQEDRKHYIAIGDMNGVLKILLLPHGLKVPGSREFDAMKAYINREESRRDFVEARWRGREQERTQKDAEKKRLAQISSTTTLSDNGKLQKMKEEYENYLADERKFLQQLGLLPEEQEMIPA